jgi:hypothetical protein
MKITYSKSQCGKISNRKRLPQIKVSIFLWGQHNFHHSKLFKVDKKSSHLYLDFSTYYSKQPQKFSVLSVRPRYCPARSVSTPEVLVLAAWCARIAKLRSVASD